MNQSESPRLATLAERLDYLFATVRPRGRGEYTYREVAQAINDSPDDVTISASYLWQLRKGGKVNPSVRHLEALARFFGVPTRWLLGDDDADEVTSQLELLAAMRDADVREIALRASGLSDAALQMVKNVVENTRKMEGLPDDD
ncbi:XRE family transcriptional regulator [Actinobacteria bacterium YIM 96077]|uniref:XRE family transcriptional regulator n=1 Tax=Phytoactinopolyspora halophila TaxID=1981511 RepID=A0A329QLP6_9ACTN|nr:helix-turn-helix transcriptional regulator [Phytoactinopolyspora halophila]AYY13000.1 XRE family transcriptional regulator [Actinobacteria bacterium YIM 96077]RAW13264.1 XRE family transcriptional regulator [Phytoactinopolyspora halophila]